MSNRDDGGQGILSLRSHGWVEPRRGVDIKIGIGGQAQVAVDALEILAIIVRQEKCMRSKGS